MYKPLACSLLALLVTGCLGDGGGSAYQGDVGNETPADQGGPFDVGNEDPADQGGAFDVGTEEGGSSGPSSAGSDEDLFELCMETCIEEVDADYCRDFVCDEFDDGGDPPGGGGPPGGGNVDYCEDEDRELLEETFSDACVDCLCFIDPDTADETTCSRECGF